MRSLKRQHDVFAPDNFFWKKTINFFNIFFSTPPYLKHDALGEWAQIIFSEMHNHLELAISTRMGFK